MVWVLVTFKAELLMCQCMIDYFKMDGILVPLYSEEDGLPEVFHLNL